MLSIKKSSERLNLILMENSMTPTEFAHTYDISKSALSNYLNGKSLIRRDKAESLGERLNIDPEWLMGGDVSRMPLLHDAADSGNASSDNSEAFGENLISEGSREHTEGDPLSAGAFLSPGFTVVHPVPYAQFSSTSGTGRSRRESNIPYRRT
ncbi:dNA complete genome [Firmicutes bacterium CAG:791]|nr:dNA complete genome [Firmicutes bacterium CAG:791]